MSLILYSYKIFISVFIVAFIIKLMDDYIDDGKGPFSNLIEEMGKGIVPYTLVLFCTAMLFDNKTPISLFINSYIIGMFSDLNRTLTFRVRGWQEAIIIFSIGVYFLNINEMITSFILVLVIQLIDDLIDSKTDRYYARQNIALRYGKVEVLLSCIILFLIAIKLDSIKSIICILVFSIFQIAEKIYEKRI